MIGLESEVPAAVLDRDISKAGEHLYVTEVGLGNELDSSS